MAGCTVGTFLDAIKKGKCGNDLKRCLQTAAKDELLSWKDEHAMDILHHAILLNSSEAVQLLLSERYFQAPYQPSVNLYAHLASYLGYRNILNILLEFRIDDFRVKRKIILPENSRMSSKNKGCQSETNNRERFPLDIAADEKHVECVKTILNLWVLKVNPDTPSKGDVTLACLANSPSALRLILKEKQRSDDIKHAIEVCMKQACPECLDILLQLKKDTSSMFEHMNLYHVLYTYSSTFGDEGYGALPKMTSVLIKNKCSVKTKSPPRTYPIYSLLSHAFSIHSYENTKHYLKCLQMLLSSGADPNFDEVAFEKSQLKRGAKSVVGRHSYSSSLHCLLETVEIHASNLQSRPLVVKFVAECAETLVHHNASVKQVGRIGGSTSFLRGNVIHQYAKSSVIIGVDIDIMRCILRYGADPDDKVGGKYAINVYIDQLYEKLISGEVADVDLQHMEDAKNMLLLCDYMRNHSIREAARINKQEHCREVSRFVKPYVEYFSVELDKCTKFIKSLRRMAAWVVWKQCGTKSANVYALNVSARVKTDIIPLCDGTATPFVLGD